MIEAKKISEIVEAYISDSSLEANAGKEYFLVDVSVDKNNTIVVEIDSMESVPLDYCIALSKHIEDQLDRDVEDFELEVGSAGLTSPFKVLKQYQKYEGQEVEVQTKNGPKYTGVLMNVTETSFELQFTQKVKKEGMKKKVEETVVLPFTYEQIKYTKYSITFK